jgi:CMP/dCMP kinase
MMIITINGRPGAGKSTVAETLAKRLGFRVLDVGGLRRKEARRRHMTLAAFNSWSEAHPDAGDKAFDRALVRAARRQGKVVITSRTAFHFLPESFKVYLDVSTREGARRALEDRHERANEVGARPTIPTIMRLQRQRVRSDTRRYQKLYGIDIFQRKHYDFVLNTTRIPIPTMVRDVAQAYRKWRVT